MPAKIIIKANSYYDSVTLMRISGQVARLAGVEDVLVGMGTDLNKASLARMELLTAEADAASPNDLMIGIRAINDDVIEAALREVEELLAPRQESGLEVEEQRPRTIRQACQLSPGFNLALISVPGIYAAREAREALRQGMHVFLFSDNVSVEDEIALKEMAAAQGLLMMGPDCGTAIINGIPLGFANRVRRGSIGIIGASGTGIQQVTTLIDSLGEGISQAIGTGGRDLSEQVGGRTTLAALEALARDSQTQIIVIISKPPAPEVAAKILARAQQAGKPVVLCLLGARPLGHAGANISQCSNLEEAALRAVALARGGKEVSLAVEEAAVTVEALRAGRKAGQKYVRALYGGGTLCDEAMVVFRQEGIPIHSNIPFDQAEALADIERSQGHTFLDMGDDYFTRGRPHPMIEPGLRVPRLLAEAADPEVAVILFDVILGHGSHADPGGIMAEAVQEASQRAAGEGRRLVFVAALIGTDNDPQGLVRQRRQLEEAGVVVLPSNIRAARLAAALVKE
ncbi:acyl-CoA synthetase FdrA [Moorella sp. ACPs]|uniref:acyl-CoA synthetase FdrA n=1 Tax=Neomoorella carbonis TaxID=3062783 RepID=UPI00324BF11F